MFRNAIVRVPAENFADGITTGKLGKPDYQIAKQQHQAYSEALRFCGLTIWTLPEDRDYPDSTFVEDTAVLVKDHAVFSRPGAESRLGEVEKIKGRILDFFNQSFEILDPGTLDGGDICEADHHFFIGVSERTNETGAKQFQEIVQGLGYTADLVDIRGNLDLLHLKSGISYLGNGHLVLIDSLATQSAFQNYHKIRVDPEENYAANCVAINDYVLVAEGFPKLASRLEALGYRLISLDVSEFQKMDGGLSCLSLRF